jgi:hypothetical protein
VRIVRDRLEAMLEDHGISLAAVHAEEGRQRARLRRRLRDFMAEDESPIKQTQRKNVGGHVVVARANSHGSRSPHRTAKGDDIPDPCP